MNIKMFLSLIITGILSFSIVGCADDGPFEEIGEEVDDTVDDTSDAIEDACESATDTDC